MYERLASTNRWLGWLRLTHNSYYEPMLRRIVGSDDISSLRELAEVLEPVKDYAREETAPETPTSLVPLNRLVDAIPPESSVAREFSTAVDSLIAGTANVDTKQEIGRLLLSWRENQTRLQPLESQSFSLKEVVPLSRDLAAVSEVGLEALDYLERGDQPPDDWKAQQMSILQRAQQPKAQMLLMVVPPIQKLVEFVAAERAAKLQ
jgi:hexosaminidase